MPTSQNELARASSHTLKDISVQDLEDGRLRVNRAWLSRLHDAGLDRFEALQSLAGGKVIRDVPGRTTVQLELNSSDYAAPLFYLKRYDPVYLRGWRYFKRAVHWPGAGDEALREWQMIFRLRQRGFATAEPIAVGRGSTTDPITPSCLLTREISGGVPAHEYFRHHLRHATFDRKRRWLAELGRFARRFQEARFIHKDFYLVHFFVVEDGEDWQFHLIDLQRARGPHWHLPRWYFKDAAGLTFSARHHAGCSRTELLHLYNAYAGIRKLRHKDKRLINKLWCRAARIARHRPKYGFVTPCYNPIPARRIRPEAQFPSAEVAPDEATQS